MIDLQAHCCLFYFLLVIFISFCPPSYWYISSVIGFRRSPFFCIFCFLFLIIYFRFNSYHLRGNSQVLTYFNSVNFPLQILFYLPFKCLEDNFRKLKQNKFYGFLSFSFFNFFIFSILLAFLFCLVLSLISQWMFGNVCGRD